MFMCKLGSSEGGGASAIGVSPLPIVVYQCWGGGGCIYLGEGIGSVRAAPPEDRGA